MLVTATPTKIMIRAKARDAKFIGSSLGGAYIIVRDKTSQKILAEGKTTGGTGNTDLIMKMPKQEEPLLPMHTPQDLQQTSISANLLL